MVAMGSEGNNGILYHYRSFVKIGELERYIITYDLYDDEELPENIQLNSLWLKVKNSVSLTYRAAYLVGPYILYCDVRTENYNHRQKLYVSADQPQFEATVQPQQEFTTELSLHDLKKRYVWIVDVVSQVLFTPSAQVSFELTVASSKQAIEAEVTLEPQAGSFCSNLNVNRHTTLDLWNLPQQMFDDYRKTVHLVILTHGLHSNVGADMHYLKEQIEQCQKHYRAEVIVVKGFTENVCKTEKGVKYLGARLGEYIIKQLYTSRVKKISFIGHSLGGLTQAFAIAYIAVNYPWFFECVEPINFITLASPLLGLVTNNPLYVNAFLSLGIVGKTGQDLRLQAHTGDEHPLLFSLPGTITQRILKRFKKRTLYANATNDGIVPLYTSALLYLDYDDILEKLKSAPQSTIEKQDFFTKTVLNPLSKAMNAFAPQSHATTEIPKMSVIQSVMSILLPPLPDREYLMDPSTNEDVIVHDKIYGEEDIPQSEKSPNAAFWNSTFLSFANLEQYKDLEEDMAQRWHKGMTWRKVIVNLKPDAHNNIIVRRRFANAYGWPVIDHLVQNHFNGSDCAYQDNMEEDTNIDEVLEKDRTWINRRHSETFFDVGPTGMISSVGEILENIKNNAFQKTMDSKRESDDSLNEEIFKFHDI